jgi:sterol 3beta-glucosyltransferase
MGKRIAIAALGTMGDILPFVALARELKRRGHSIAFGSSKDFEQLIVENGIEFHNLGSDIQTFLRRSQFERVISKGELIYAPTLLREGQQILKDAGRHTWKMAQNADVILFHMTTTYCMDIAEALSIPGIMTAFQPLNPTGEFPYLGYERSVLNPLLRGATGNRTSGNGRFDPLVNKLSYVVLAAQQTYYDFPRDRMRRKLLGLKPKKRGGFEHNGRGERQLSLHAYSSILSPRPRDWPDSAIVTGFWPHFDETGWKPDPQFQAFLDAGEPPIYLGFGSMAFGAKRNTEVIVEALRLWGGRAVVSRGWGGLGQAEMPSSVYQIPRAPHFELFKHVKAVVHHGGAGTTHTGLYAGKPTFILPQFFDQPYWGRRVHALGCGPAPIRLRKINPSALAVSFDLLSTNGAYKAAAERVAEKLRAEDGIARAIEIIEAAMVMHPVQRGRGGISELADIAS